ncbi:MAG: HEAT repeat domain-containing protein [Burkholderiales bacterium]|nr:HEAT repeat domain-containing protein [Burkholderiales bacterium]
MNHLGAFFFLFLFTFFLWFGLSAYVVLNRLLYDFRLRSLQEAQTRITDPTPALPAGQGTRKVHGILGRLSRPVIYRVSADVSQPPWVSEALCAQILSRWGMPQVLEEASGHNHRPDRWQRVSALSVLTRIRSPQIHELLRQSLTERDADIAAAAVVLLGRLQDRRAAEILILALCQGRYSRSRIATQLDHFTISLLDLLVPLLVDSSPQVRYWAVSLLSRYRKIGYLGTLIALLADDPDAGVREAVAQTLGTIGGPPAPPALLKLLGDSSGVVRAHAARALGQLGRTDFASSITRLLADRDWAVRLAARESLVALGPAARRAVTAELNSPDTFARDSAAEVLLKLPSSRTRKPVKGSRRQNRQPEVKDTVAKSASNFPGPKHQ